MFSEAALALRGELSRGLFSTDRLCLLGIYLIISMHLSNACIDPIMHSSKLSYLSEGDEHGNNNWRNDLYVCTANRNLFIRFLAKGRVEHDSL